MPPNTGEIAFDDLESTFDLSVLKDPKDFLIAYHAARFDTQITANNDTDDCCIDNPNDLNESSQDKDNEVSNTYWEWSPATEETNPVTPAPKEINKEEFINNIILEEEIRQCLMVERVEKRLVDESKRRNNDTMDYDFNSQNEAMEMYWNWAEDGRIKEDCLELTVESIENRLVADAKSGLLAQQESKYELASHADEECGNEYWDWEEDNVVPVEVFPIEVLRKEVNKEELLRKILLEEEIRQGLMVTNIEKSLLKEARTRSEECKEYESEISKQKCAGYWSW